MKLALAGRGALVWRLVVGGIGVAVLVGVVRWAGASNVQQTLVRALPWMPALALLEGARIPLELWVSRHLLGDVATRVPWSAFVRAHLVFYPLSIVAPGGRPVAEATKAAMLGAYAGAPRAAAAATASQATSFVADACFGFMGAAAVYALSGWSLLTFVLVCFSLGAAGLAVLVAVTARSELPAWFRRRFPKFGSALDRYRSAAREQPMFVPGAVLLLLTARLCQLGFFCVALAAVGATVFVQQAFGTLSLAMIASAVGDAIPAQLGATDALFALSASTLGSSTVTMTALAVLFHAAQLGWVSVGALASALWPSRSLQCRNVVEHST